MGDILIRPDSPAKGPIDRKIIPDIDVIIDYNRDLSKARSQRPDRVHGLLHLAFELLFQRHDNVGPASARLFESNVPDR